MTRARDVTDLSDVFLKCRTWGTPGSRQRPQSGVGGAASVRTAVHDSRPDVY